MRWPLLLVLLALLSGCAGSRSSRQPTIGETFALSPDDSTLVFTYLLGPSAALYRADADGRNVRLIAAPRGNGAFARPAVSPDGRLAAFTAPREGHPWEFTLMVVPLAGGTPREIPTDINTVTEIAFSRDGRHLYVLGADHWYHSRGPAGDSTHDIDLYVVGVDGTGLRRLTQFDAAVMEDLSVVGDPERVVVRLVVAPGASGGYVFLDPADAAAAPVPVWQPSASMRIVQRASVSPDGRRVAYTDVMDASNLYVMDVATQQARLLPLPGPFPSVQSVRWARHSDALYVFRSLYYERSGPTRVELGGDGYADVRIDPAEVVAARRAAP